MKPLQEGDHVWYRMENGEAKIRWNNSGVISHVYSYDKYRIKTDQTNRQIRRHRQDIK